MKIGLANPQFLENFLHIIAQYADESRPLHRAKALKWAKPDRSTQVKMLSHAEKELFWQEIKSSGYLRLNASGYIIGLNSPASDVMQSSNKKDL